MLALEIIGSLLGVVYVYLEWHERQAMWLFGLLMPIAYLIVFFKGGLYANASIQLYYIIASFYGILVWRGIIKDRHNPEATTSIKSLTPVQWLWLVIVIVALAGVMTLLLSHIPGESNHPFLDGFTSSLNMVGMWMLAKKYYQQWYIWLIVNPVTVVMCILSQMYVVAAFYAVSFVMSIMGYRAWLKKYRSNV